MIELHTSNTQNARKISIMLEECALPYEIHWVDLIKGEQKEKPFLKLNPNGRIPAIVDPDVQGDPVTIAETGAILIYLAEKTGKFLPSDGQNRWSVLQWLMWQMSGIGPTFGNLAHFVAAVNPDAPTVNSYLRASRAKEVSQYAIQRFGAEAMRLISVLESLLQQKYFIADELSIADFATYAWVESIWPGFKAKRPTINDDFPNTALWMETLRSRPAVKRGLEKLAW